jgi:GDSL-like lipase/acylhydrolase family protein
MEAVKLSEGAAAMSPVPRVSAGRRIATGLAVALMALALSAIAAETALRLVGYRMPVLLPDSVRATYHLARNSQFLYLGYLPGAVEDYATPVSLNDLGFHDHDYAPERPWPSTYRIMVLGDSYVAAWEVPLEETFHKRLEARLAKENPLGRGSYQVIAFGQGRSAQEAEIEWLRKYGPVYKPDVVLLLFFCGNDFMENDPVTFGEASDFGLRYIGKVAPRKLKFFRRLMIVPSSRLNGLIAEAATEYYAEHLDRFDATISAADLLSPEIGIYRNPLAPEWQAAFERTGKLLEVARHEAKALGARFVLASLSGPQEIGDLAPAILWTEAKDPAFDYDRPDRWVRGWAASHHVPLVELGPPLAKIGRRRVFWKHDQHLNSYGHAVVADLLYPALVREAKE